MRLQQPKAVTITCLCLNQIVGFSRNLQPLFPKLLSIIVILFAMKTSNSAGDLMVGSGVIAIGTFQVPGEATISGTVQGELTAAALNVLPTGEVTGKSTAQTILVSGKMNQSTTAMQSLVVDATGVITGEIAYGDLEIRRGGELLGSITQIKNQSKLTK
jgi:cytoskeletal protein CcmA (bactofilin family)